MRGNSHVRFLGGKGVAIPPTYPMCDVKSLKLTVWQQKPTKPAIPLAEAGVAGLISNDVVREPTLIVTLVENNPQGKVETASYKAVRVQASIAWLSK